MNQTCQLGFSDNSPGRKSCLRSDCFDPSRLWRVLALGYGGASGRVQHGRHAKRGRHVDGPCEPGDRARGQSRQHGRMVGESYGGYGPDRICGAVDYAYNIGKYEVTAGQYTEFLNAVATTRTPTGCTTRPCGRTTYGCKIQRTRQFGQLHVQRGRRLGQPAGELRVLGRRGAVRQLAAQRPADRAAGSLDHRGRGVLPQRRDEPSAALMAVDREADWKWAIPSEDEWYKAAYHKNDGDTGNYFDYPTSNDSVPSNDLIDPDPGNNANFYQRRLHDRQPVLHDGGRRVRELGQPLRHVRPGRQRLGVERDGGLRRFVAWVAWRQLGQRYSNYLAASYRVTTTTRRTRTTTSGSAWQVFLSPVASPCCYAVPWRV